jgi:hypothetical protein
MLVCDVCGEVVERPHFRLRILRALPEQAVNVMKTVGNIDMHDECLDTFKEWLKQNRKKEAAK